MMVMSMTLVRLASLATLSLSGERGKNEVLARTILLAMLSHPRHASRAPETKKGAERRETRALGVGP
jgi:hypothetical protein